MTDAERARRYRRKKKAAKHHLARNTGHEDWYTPPQYLDAARAVLGDLDLDPASSDEAQKTVQAGRYFTREDDGLRHEWQGRVWLNPPYTFPAIEHFCRKLVDELAAGRVTAAILLTNNSSDTGWFRMAAAAAGAICLTKRRIKFIGPKRSSPLQGQAFFYFGPNKARFAKHFGQFGTIVEPQATTEERAAA